MRESRAAARHQQWPADRPYQLSAPVFSWSAGESAVAGEVTIGGSTTAAATLAPLLMHRLRL